MPRLGQPDGAGQAGDPGTHHDHATHRTSMAGRIDSPLVRLVVARCQVDYAGRLTAHLPMATRVLMLKSDGSVLVHSDGGSYKPLNWMSPPCTVKEGTSEDGQAEWLVEAKSGDSLRILIEEVLHDSSHDLGDRPGPAEGRRREAPPGAPRRPPGDPRRGTDTGPARVPHRHRPRRPDVPRRRRPVRRGRDQAARGDRRRRAAHPLPRAAQPRPALVRKAPSAASSRHRRSSRRRGCSPRTVASPARPSTTTCSAGWTTRASDCSRDRAVG